MEAFLKSCGWAGAERAPLKGDASNRRYIRLRRGAEISILMDAPPEKGEDTRPFIGVTNWLREQGYSAPQILAQDPEAGFLLLEDLGPDLFKTVCAADPMLEHTLYAAAVDLLADSAARAAPSHLGAHPLADYDAATYLREAQLLTEWYLPTPVADPAYDDLILEACADLRPTVVVQRDYHAENLIWLPGRAGLARVGLLDYQDALRGHPGYDLVSLLEDARRDTSAALQKDMLARFIHATGAEDAGFRAAYAALGAQRNLKILGIFARLCRRDGKPIYLAHMPRVWAHLQRDLAHPGLSGLRDWVSQNVPPPTPAFLEHLRQGSPA